MAQSQRMSQSSVEISQTAERILGRWLKKARSLNSPSSSTLGSRSTSIVVGCQRKADGKQVARQHDFRSNSYSFQLVSCPNPKNWYKNIKNVVL